MQRLPLRACIAAAAAALLAATPGAASTRVKDIVDVENVRPNQLVGYGLVVGLPGTGDRTNNSPFTEESLQAMLERMGVNVRDAKMKPARWVPPSFCGMLLVKQYIVS